MCLNVRQKGLPSPYTQKGSKSRLQCERIADRQKYSVTAASLQSALHPTIALSLIARLTVSARPPRSPTDCSPGATPPRPRRHPCVCAGTMAPLCVPVQWHNPGIENYIHKPRSRSHVPRITTGPEVSRIYQDVAVDCLLGDGGC